MDADLIIDKLVALVTTDDVHDPQSNHILAAALISRLKAVNRASNHATRLTRETTTAARQEMDQSHLGLQNLLYEKQHLEREIQKCRQFASMYQDVPLYSLEDFIELAPEQARSPEALADEHQLMLNRLSFELAERTRLDQQKKEILLVKKDLLKESKAKQTTMDNIKAHIDQVSLLASDIQKKVDELVLPIPPIVESSNRNTPS
ncbi:hypothetical protein BDZ89DRAFT_1055879 [Hymenopellis radicata]|nr:hypothetical protein BDZ89DRAFT_1055879 [Hymenopellis radicata]